MIPACWARIHGGQPEGRSRQGTLISEVQSLKSVNNRPTAFIYLPTGWGRNAWRPTRRRGRRWRKSGGACRSCGRSCSSAPTPLRSASAARTPAQSRWSSLDHACHPVIDSHLAAELKDAAALLGRLSWHRKHLQWKQLQTCCSQHLLVALICGWTALLAILSCLSGTSHCGASVLF